MALSVKVSVLDVYTGVVQPQGTGITTTVHPSAFTQAGSGSQKGSGSDHTGGGKFVNHE